VKKLSVIYSFRNEEKVISELIARTVSSLVGIGLDYEIIFVDDCSTDKSEEKILNERHKNNRIKLIKMKSRFGQMPCIVAGLKYSSGDAVIFLDSDLQDPPELFPRLVEEYNRGFDVVHTIRTKRLGESHLKMLLTKVAYKLIRVTSKLNVHENAGDFKLISRSVVNDILLLTEEEPFLRTLIPWMNSNSSVVYYDREPRFDGVTHFSFWGLNPFETFFIGLTSFSTFFLYLPFIFLLIFTVLSVVLILIYGFSPVLFLTSLGFIFVLFSLGIMGAYLARVNRQSKNRPLYIVREEIGFNEI